MAFEAERDVAAEVALQAGAYIQMHAGKLHRKEIREKGIHDLVTQVDIDVQSMIIDALQKHFPSYGFLAEENVSGNVPFQRSGNKCRWIIDPIDGTTNFTHGLPPYAVSIALQCADEIVVGVILDVPRNELFTAVKGGGLYVNGVRRHVSQTETLEESLLATGFPFREFEYIDEYLTVLKEFMLKSQGIRRPGAAAIDLAHIACGRFDGFFEAGLSPWDVAAGICLIREGGGQVSDFTGSNQMLFGRQILASNGRIHQALIETVQPLAKALQNRTH